MILTDQQIKRHYEEFRDLWQARCLEHATGKMARVMQSVLAHSYPDHISELFKVVYPGFKSIALPFFVSAGRIAVSGEIVARLARTPEDVLNYEKCPWARVFVDEADMTKAFRELADALKLSDSDREALFKCARAWLVCDYRQPLSGNELEDYIGKRTANGNRRSPTHKA